MVNQHILSRIDEAIQGAKMAQGKDQGLAVVIFGPGEARDLFGRIGGPPQPVLGSTPVQTLVPFDDQLGTINGFVANRTEYMTKMLDTRLATKMLLIVNGSAALNQALTVRVVGHWRDEPRGPGLINIGGAITLASGGGILGLEVALDLDWYPWMSVSVLAGATAPTAGAVTVQGFGQRWLRAG